MTVVGDARRRQVAARGRVPRVGRGADRPRPLPALRRGHHLLAGGGGGEAAGRAAVRSGRRGLAPLPARRETDEGTSRRGDRLGVPQAARRAARRSSASSTTSSGARRRSSTWSSTSRSSRAVRPLLLLCMARPELLDRRPGLARDESGSSRSTDAVGCGQPDRDRRPGGAAHEDRGCGRRQPAVHRRDAGDGRARAATSSRCRRRAGAARGPPRPARPGRAARARARRGRRRGLPPRRRAGARARGGAR